MVRQEEHLPSPPALSTAFASISTLLSQPKGMGFCPASGIDYQVFKSSRAALNLPGVKSCPLLCTHLNPKHTAGAHWRKTGLRCLPPWFSSACQIGRHRPRAQPKLGLPLLCPGTLWKLAVFQVSPPRLNIIFPRGNLLTANPGS